VSRRRGKLPSLAIEAEIDSLSHEGRGISHVTGKTTFIDGALPGETVRFRYRRQRSRFDEGFTESVLKVAPDRVDPKCEHFGLCGGCSLQHMAPGMQLKHKQDVLLEQFSHIGDVKPGSILPPLTGPVWGYRHRARLGVKYVQKKGKVLVGFREKRSAYITDLKQCEVLHPQVGYKLGALQELISNLSIYEQLPQIEVAVGDSETTLVFRHLVELSDTDIEKLNTFSEKYNVSVYLQSGGPDTVKPINSNNKRSLTYRLDDHDLVIEFNPTSFIQINADINKAMINRVLDLLEPQSEESVLDLFCGLGNITLPLARYSGNVTGIEGDKNLIEQAKLNARRNRINNVEFYMEDLANIDQQAAYINKSYHKIVLDPPRTGAQEIITAMDLSNVSKLVYVSCNPATLARDAGILVRERGLILTQAGVMDMFPHTSHVESVALFEQ
jgi:23S rRNA (uracil1939-C5)-methyltransferase